MSPLNILLHLSMTVTWVICKTTIKNFKLLKYNLTLILPIKMQQLGVISISLVVDFLQKAAHMSRSTSLQHCKETRKQPKCKRLEGQKKLSKNRTHRQPYFEVPDCSIEACWKHFFCLRNKSITQFKYKEENKTKATL